MARHCIVWLANVIEERLFQLLNSLILLIRFLISESGLQFGSINVIVQVVIFLATVDQHFIDLDQPIKKAISVALE